MNGTANHTMIIVDRTTTFIIVGIIDGKINDGRLIIGAPLCCRR